MLSNIISIGHEKDMRKNPFLLFLTASLILGAILPSSAGAALNYFGYYWAYSNSGGDFMEETAPFSNFITIESYDINTAKDATALDAVRRAQSLGTKVILAVQNPFFYNNGSRLTLWSDWQSGWNNFRQTFKVDQMVQEGNIFGFYVIDEPYWNGATRAEVETAINAIHSSYPGSKTIITFCTGCYEVNSNGKPLLMELGVPAGLDIISFDHYGIDSLEEYNAKFINDLNWVKQNSSLPVLLTTEAFNAFLTPTPTQQSWYVNTAVNDSRVIGLWHYAYTDNTLIGGVGARAFPDVINYHKQVFNSYIGPKPPPSTLTGSCSANACTASVQDLVVTWNSNDTLLNASCGGVDMGQQGGSGTSVPLFCPASPTTCTFTSATGKTGSFSCTITPTPSSGNNIQGSHDGNSGLVSDSSCLAYGWAGDPDSPSGDVQVRILVDGVQKISSTANQLRSDLNNTWGTSHGCQNGTCGFNFSLSSYISDGISHVITAQAQDLQTSSWQNLQYDGISTTPKNITCPAVTSPPPPPSPSAITTTVISECSGSGQPQNVVSWTFSGSIIAGKTLYYCNSGSTCTPNTGLISNFSLSQTSSYTHTNLSLSTPYRYQIRTTDGVNSNIAGVTTPVSCGLTTDITPPTVSITSPPNGAEVTPNTDITITANASDNVGVTKVEFRVDGVLKCTDTAAPYACVWTTPLLAGQTRQLVAKAYDAAGNPGTSAIVSVTTSSSAPPPPPPPVSLTADLKVNGSDGPVFIRYNATAAFSWTSANATACTLSVGGGVPFSVSTSGSVVSGPLTSSGSVKLTCTGSGGSVSDSVKINVIGAPSITPPPQPPAPPSSDEQLILNALSGIPPQSQLTKSTKFAVGDRVKTTDNLNVRLTPSKSGALLGTQPAGALGMVVAGPQFADGYWWWNVNFDTGHDGWAAENWLVKVSSAPSTTPSPSPATSSSAHSAQPSAVLPSSDELLILNTLSGTTLTKSTKFAAGDRVKTTDNLNVRLTPSKSGVLLGTQSVGSSGTVVTGPQYSDGYWWWNVNFDSGPDGWSAENWLVKK